MSLRTNIERATWMIKECSRWLALDIEARGFASLGSMSELDLEASEQILRALADEIAERRQELLANVPQEMKVAAE